MGRLYNKINHYVTESMTGDILEIGMDRGEGSTRSFINMALSRGVTFVGVDMDPNQTQSVVEQTNIEVHNCTGEHYLENTNRKFSVVYLDNFDWNYWSDGSTQISRQAVAYSKYMNSELNNVNSQASHLMQAILLQEHLTDECVIMCDDTWYSISEMVYLGKCSAAIPYLLTCGFKVVHQEGLRNNPPSCVILTRSSIGL